MKQILIVEDEELLSSAFRMILEKEGFNVKVASNGREALEIIPAFKPRLILLDLLMPEMGGVEFLQNYEPVGDIASEVIVLSNLHDKDMVDKVMKLGVKEYLVKSQITPSALVQITRTALA